MPEAKRPCPHCGDLAHQEQVCIVEFATAASTPLQLARRSFVCHKANRFPGWGRVAGVQPRPPSPLVPMRLFRQLVRVPTLLVTVLVPTLVGAQPKESLGDRLKRMGREAQAQARAERCQRDPSRCDADASVATTLGSDARSAGDRVSVVSASVQGSDSLRALWDTTGKLSVRRTARACSLPNRPACVAGWDLRMLAVRLPADTAPARAAVPVTYVIENRGRVASPATEVQLCSADGGEGAWRCAESFEEFELAPVAPGETVTITRAWRTPAYNTTDGLRLLAVIDRERAAGPTNRSNDAAITRTLAFDAPTMQFVSYEAPERVAAGRPFDIAFTLRNRSFAAASPATELEVRSNAGWGGPSYRIPLPALGPRQAYTARIRVRPGAMSSGSSLSTVIDPDGRVTWGQQPAHEPEKGTFVSAVTP